MNVEPTIAFVDPAGFTALTEVHGDAAAVDLLNLFSDVAQCGAEVVKTIEDAVALQDEFLREVHRVLIPPASVAGSASLSSIVFRLTDVADSMTIVDPDTFGERLERSGFTNVDVRSAKGAFRFGGCVPHTATSPA